MGLPSLRRDKLAQEQLLLADSAAHHLISRRKPAHDEGLPYDQVRVCHLSHPFSPATLPYCYVLGREIGDTGQVSRSGHPEDRRRSRRPAG
jgi:hypothetical protein